MFLNKTIFKKWIKTAYNSNGLKVGRVFDGFVLASDRWILWADEQYMPNWIKASVMEHVGHLPQDGMIFRATKNEPVQMIIEDNFLNLPKEFLNATVPFTVTPVVCGSKYDEYRILQNKQTHNTIILSEDLYKVIDLSNLGVAEQYPDGFGENPPMGPCAKNNAAEIVYWKNEYSALALCTVKTGDSKTQEIMKILSGIDFMEEK